ncbi:MAG: ribosome assembly RNA-binding protein YhbY [Myxococcota bacterium]
MPLTPKQKRHLKGLAHHLNPVVLVGGAGVTEAIQKTVVAELKNHELIKVRIHRDAPITAKLGGSELAEECSAELVQVIGRMAVLYKRRTKEPSIKLPTQ